MKVNKNPDILGIQKIGIEKIPEQCDRILSGCRETVNVQIEVEDGRVKTMVNGKEFHLGPRLFKVFLSLCIGYAQSKDGWLYKNQMGDPQTIARYICRLRQKTSVVIENSCKITAPGYYRIKGVDTLRINTKLLKLSTDPEVREIVERVSCG